MTGPEARRLLNLCDPHGHWRLHRGIYGDVNRLERRPEPAYTVANLRVETGGRNHGVTACIAAAADLDAALTRAVIRGYMAAA